MNRQTVPEAFTACALEGWQLESVTLENVVDARMTGKDNDYIIENITEDDLVVNIVAAREAPKTDFSYEDSRVRITAVTDPEANLPQSAELKADYIAPGSEAYARFEAAVRRLYGLDEGAVLNLAPYDVYFLADGVRIEPEDGKVRVSMRFTAPVAADVGGDVEVLQSGVAHIRQDGTEEKLSGSVHQDADGAMTGADFTVDSFSIMGGFEEVGVAMEPAYGAEGSTSSNLNDFFKSLSVTPATSDANGNYTLVPGETYTLRLNFAEDQAGIQFDMDSPLTGGPLPEIFDSFSGGTFDAKISELDTSGHPLEYTISGNSYSYETGNLKVNWNHNDPHFEKLKEALNVSFYVEFTGAYNGETVYNYTLGSASLRYSFNPDATAELNVEKSHDAASLRYDSVSGKYLMDYTVAVTSTGANRNITITDAIDGDALSLKTDSVKVYADEACTQEIAPKSLSATSAGYTLTLDALGHQKTAYVKYSCYVDVNALDAGSGGNLGTAADGTNTVQVTGKNHDLSADVTEGIARFAPFGTAKNLVHFPRSKRALPSVPNYPLGQ